jgi:hypothetical protein
VSASLYRGFLWKWDGRGGGGVSTTRTANTVLCTTDQNISPLYKIWTCECYILIQSEEYRLRVPENNFLRRAFGQRGRNKTRRKLHHEELHNLYSSADIIEQSNQAGCDGQGMRHLWGEMRINTRF